MAAGKEVEGAVPDEDKKRAAHQALVVSVLNAAGRASPEMQARAFGFEPLSPEGFQAGARYLLKRGTDGKLGASFSARLV
jgi:hypothetical protein